VWGLTHLGKQRTRVRRVLRTAHVDDVAGQSRGQRAYEAAGRLGAHDLRPDGEGNQRVQMARAISAEQSFMPIHGPIHGWHSTANHSTQWNSISIQWQSAHLLEDGEHVSPELLWKGGEREHERRLREIVDEHQLVPAQLRERLEPAASELEGGDQDNQ
jgi:hypothetical protein